MFETQRVELNRLVEFYEKENAELKESMKKQRTYQMQENENLKTKMAILHQNDIKGLTEIFETKI